MYRVLIWGCGKFGEAMSYGIDFGRCELIFCDTNKRGIIQIGNQEVPIISPEELDEYEFDYYIPASIAFETEIIKKFKNMRIPDNKVVSIVSDDLKIAKLMDIFTTNGFQFLLSQRRSIQLESIFSGIEDIKLKLDIMNKRLTQRPTVNSKLKRIGIIQLNKILNVPERVITRCSQAVISKALEKHHIKDYIFAPIDMLNPDINLLGRCDVIIFAGGGIIKLDSAKMDFTKAIDTITSLADAYEIPVMFVGVGVEDCKQDRDFYRMQTAINRKCIKYITVRENIELMQKYIYNPDIIVEKVADPALIASDIYNIAKDDSILIGIGTINYANWELNGFPIEEKVLLDFYVQLIEELKNRGLECRLFSNGTRRDYEFAERVCLINQENMSHIIKSPVTDDEWVKTLSGFSHIVAPRLHTNIVAFSLGIPCIGMVWNKKVRWFYEMLGKPERAYEPAQFNAKEMIDKLFAISNEDIDLSVVSKYKNRTFDTVEKFLEISLNI